MAQQDYRQQLAEGMEQMHAAFARADEAQRLRELGGPSVFSQITDVRERFAYSSEQAKLAQDDLGIPVTGYDWLKGQPDFEARYPGNRGRLTRPVVGLLTGALAMFGTRTDNYNRY